MARTVLEERLVRGKALVKLLCDNCGKVSWNQKWYYENTVSRCRCHMAEKRIGRTRNGWYVESNTGDVRWERAPIWWARCVKCGDKKDLTWTQMLTVSCKCTHKKPVSRMAKNVGKVVNGRRILSYSGTKYETVCTKCGARAMHEMCNLNRRRCKCSAERNGWQKGGFRFGRMDKERTV